MKQSVYSEFKTLWGVIVRSERVRDILSVYSTQYSEVKKGEMKTRADSQTKCQCTGYTQSSLKSRLATEYSIALYVFTMYLLCTIHNVLLYWNCSRAFYTRLPNSCVTIFIFFGYIYYLWFSKSHSLITDITLLLIN